jgi:predicted phosphoribosyltransferase
MGVTRFRNRTEAGGLLAQRLAAHAGRGGVIVLALPRGGVPVGYEVARALRAPLDVLVVRKLGLPGHAELAMGAIAGGGVRVLNREVVGALHVPEEMIERVEARERLELERRERAYREGRPAPEVSGMTVILVDDGIATGSSMRSAVRVVRSLRAGRVVVASPVVAAPTLREMLWEADEVAAVLTPEDFEGVGKWYADFSQTSDEEVRRLLASASRPGPAG